MKRIFQTNYGVVAGFSLNKVLKIEFHEGAVFEDGFFVNKDIVDSTQFIGFKDATFGLFCTDIESFKTLRKYVKMADRAIGIMHHEGEEGYCVYISLNQGGAVMLSYDGKTVKKVKEYKTFSQHKYLPLHEWRYLTVDAQQSTNKKCWSIIDWFLRR